MASAPSGAAPGLVKLSKAMSRVLRHQPPPSMDSSGWVAVTDLVSRLPPHASLERIRQVTETDAKGRFQVQPGGACPPRMWPAADASVRSWTRSTTRRACEQRRATA